MKPALPATTPRRSRTGSRDIGAHRKAGEQRIHLRPRPARPPVPRPRTTPRPASSGGSYTTSCTAPKTLTPRSGQPAQGRNRLRGDASVRQDRHRKGSAIDENGNRWYWSPTTAPPPGSTEYVSSEARPRPPAAAAAARPARKDDRRDRVGQPAQGPGARLRRDRERPKGKTFSGKGSSVDSRGVRWYKVSNGGTAWISSKYSKIGTSGGSWRLDRGDQRQRGQDHVATASVNLRKAEPNPRGQLRLEGKDARE